MDLENFIHDSVVPDVIPIKPKQLILITYPSGVKVQLGNELTPTQVKDKPTATWDAEPNTLYTLIFTDPDAPSRRKGTPGKMFKHWMVVNIPENSLQMGDTTADYIGAGPPEGTGLHRYCFLLYKQCKRLDSGPMVSSESSSGRMRWELAPFVQANHLTLVGGNFYQAQYDEYVITMQKKLFGVFYPIFACLKAIGIVKLLTT
ncbi:unnamed protein product, partial [Mesorhabditis belari]|uniref:Phosphatidylethanolamine-binding protein n=1 Tax=Mesorhabditis belari TaxID=2138241 RepID=A0AAF3EFV5_9BILA